jgi:hypothetical protein
VPPFKVRGCIWLMAIIRTLYDIFLSFIILKKKNKTKQKINKKKIILMEGKIIFNYYFFLSNLNLIFKFFISRMKFIYFIIIYLNFYMIWI